MADDFDKAPDANLQGPGRQPKSALASRGAGP